MKRSIEGLPYGDRLAADPEGTEVKKVVRLAVTGTNIFTATFQDGRTITAPAGTQVVLTARPSGDELVTWR